MWRLLTGRLLTQTARQMGRPLGALRAFLGRRRSKARGVRVRAVIRIDGARAGVRREAAMTFRRLANQAQPIQMGHGPVKSHELHDRRTGVQRGIRGRHKQN